MADNANSRHINYTVHVKLDWDAAGLERLRGVLATIEPPIGSIVKDGQDIPWSRTDRGGFWESITGGDYQWSMLCEAHGPITVLWTPNDEFIGGRGGGR